MSGGKVRERGGDARVGALVHHLADPRSIHSKPQSEELDDLAAQCRRLIHEPEERIT